METKESIQQLIDTQFEKRFDVSDELNDRLKNIPSFIKKSKNRTWLAVAGVALLMSLNVMAISKKTKTNKKEFIIEQYSTSNLNIGSYE